MNWKELNNHLGTEYPFLGKITVSVCGDASEYVLHPLIKTSTCLALKALASPTHNKLVILLPNRIDSARWITTLCALEIMRQDFNKHSTASVIFQRGQKLLMGRCVVEFVEERFEPQGERMFICVKCSDGTWHIPLDRKLRFQPADTRRPLSPMKKVCDTYRAAQLNDSRLDMVLGIRTHSNLALFHDHLLLISKIGTTEDFLRNNCINGTRIIDLFMWGRLDSQGNISKMKTEQVEAVPTCVVSSDLFGSAHYIAETGKTKGVYIDGAAGFLNCLQIMDDEILKKNIPVVVLADLYDSEYLEHLTERGFRIWQWNNKNVIAANCLEVTPRTSPFYSLNHSISNFCKNDITVAECPCADLCDAVRDIRRLDRIISEIAQLKEPYCGLVSVILELSRMVRIPNKDWFVSTRNRIQNIRDTFISYRMWVSDETMKLLDSVINNIFSFLEILEQGDNPKLTEITSLINDKPSSRFFIVVNKIEDVAATTDYIRSVISSEQLPSIRILPISECISTERTNSSPHVILCGWMGYEKMRGFFHSHKFDQITLLLYPFEKKWYGSARHRWNKQNNYSIRSEDFSPIFTIPKSELHIIDHEVEKPIIFPEKDDFDIIDFELKMNSYKYAGYAATRPGDEVIKAHLLIFSQNKFSFITERHKLLVITDVIKGRAAHQDIPYKRIEDLLAGDYVIFRESDKDIIREIADKGLEKQGLSNIRKISQLWKLALRDKYMSMNENTEKLSVLLRQHGCARTVFTLKKWLNDEDTIGTKHESDIDAIAKATGYKLLNDNLTKVKEAISIVRGAHLQASGFITRKLLTVLPSIIDSEQDQKDFSVEEAIVLDLDEYGKVNILRVEDIGRDAMDIEVKWVNRLLTKEDR